MTAADGPINLMPALTQASAKSDRSDRNPYPGWIASTSCSYTELGYIRIFIFLINMERKEYAIKGIDA